VKLDRCPFCGKTNTLAIGKTHLGMTTYVTGVRCIIDKGGCGASGGTGYRDDWQTPPTEADAIKAWNRRAK